jgi:hypothetical protein
MCRVEAPSAEVARLVDPRHATAAEFSQDFIPRQSRPAILTRPCGLLVGRGRFRGAAGRAEDLTGGVARIVRCGPALLPGVGGHAQERVGVRRQVYADHLGFLVDDVVDEARVLVAETVMVLAPDQRGQQVVQRGER